MAAYGQGPYGGGNYSFGVSLGAVDFVAQSTATIAGTSILNGAFAINSSSTVVVDGVRVAFMEAHVASDTIIVIDSNVIVNQAIAIESASFVEIIGRITANIGFSLEGDSSITIDGNLKWVTNPDVPEIWVTQSDIGQSWQQTRV